MKTFSGADYQATLDFDRLTTQIGKVLEAVQDGQWHTLRELSERTDAPEASVSAQLRNLRKPKHGGYTIERRRAAGVPEQCGLYEYRLV